MGRHRKICDLDHITPKQQAVFDYIKQYIIEKHYPPSIRDIGKAVKLKSTASIFTYLNDLEKMGLIKKDPVHPRAITITAPDFQFNREASSIPIIGTVNPDVPLLSNGNINGYYLVPPDMFPGNGGFIVIMEDDSMIGCGILNGDKIIIKPQFICSDGDLIAVLNDEEVMIRRFYKEKNKIRLQAENDSIKPVVVSSCHILGKVCGLIRADFK